MDDKGKEALTGDDVDERIKKAMSRLSKRFAVSFLISQVALSVGMLALSQAYPQHLELYTTLAIVYAIIAVIPLAIFTLTDWAVH